MIFSLAITGPTASGKTALSISLCERLRGEIISSDSMQIYKGMDIGTAKATLDERARVPHHLIDFVDPTENYSVENYRELAMSCARDISSRGKTPIFVGGTGLYVDSLLRAPQSDIPESDPLYRDKILSGIGCEADAVSLWERLREVDPDSAEKIHYNNIKRVIRALEIYERCGITKTELDRRSKEASSEIFVGMITLGFHSRETLYHRIDKRVDIMVNEGLFDEVRSLYTQGMLPDGSTAAQAIGYKEIVSCIKGECTEDEAIERIKLSSRRYAKRQLTWFRHTEGACTLFVDDESGNMRDADSVLNEAIELYTSFAEEYRAKYETDRV